MKLTRIIVLGLAFLMPSMSAFAGDEKPAADKTAEGAPADGEKKATKKKKAKKEGATEEKKEEAPPAPAAAPAEKK